MKEGPDIAELLQSDDENERKRAAVLLAKNINRENFQRLQEVADFDESLELRFYAKKVLNALRNRVSQQSSAKQEKAKPVTAEELEDLRQGFLSEERVLSVIQFLRDKKQKDKLPYLISAIGAYKESRIILPLLMVIGHWGGDNEIKVIAPYLNHKNPRIRANAIEALEQIGSFRTYPFLISKLEDEDNRVRANALRSVRNLGSVNAMKVLQAMVKASGSAMRASAAYALQFYPETKSLEFLELLLSDPEPTVCNNARKSLKIFCEKGFEGAEELLKKYGSYNDFSADSDSSIRELQAGLSEKEADIRLAAVMRAVKEGGGAGVLLEHFPTERDLRVRATILSALGRLQYHKAITLLVENLRAKDVRCRANAVEALGFLKDQNALKKLIPFLYDKNNRVRANAIIALYNEKKAGVYAALLNMLRSEDEAMLRSVIYVIMLLKEPDYYEYLYDLEKSVFDSVSSRASDCLKILEEDGINVQRSLDTERSSRVFRVFISSTFNDLKQERNALQERVFPKLRNFCRQRGYRFQAIDLRWGITDEASVDQKTMAICLEEIRRCQEISPRPNFIALLGDRYGWMPLPFEIPVSEFLQIREFCENNEAELQQESLIRKALAAVPEHSFSTTVEMLDYWYRLDENGLYRSGDGSEMEAVRVLQSRTGDYAAYGNSDLWSTIEQALGLALRRATKDFPAERRVFYDTSATAQEIVNGVFSRVNNARKHVFCFFRHIANLPELVKDLSGGELRAVDYVDSDGENRFAPFLHKKLVAMKKKLYSLLPQNIFEYEAEWQDGSVSETHLEKLCFDVYQSLSGVIMGRIALDIEHGALSREMQSHETFRNGRARDFSGRTEYLCFIADYLQLRTGKHYPLVFFGKSGTGKSSLMAKAAIEAIKENLLHQEQDCYVLSRFLGSTPESSDIRALLRSICREIALVYGINDEIPDDYDGLERRFSELLNSVKSDRRLFIFLDGLDQLSNADRAHELKWLPAELPENVRLILSTLDGTASGFQAQDVADAEKCLSALRGRLPSENLKCLEKMSLDEGQLLLDCWLQRANRRLTGEQRDLILEKFRLNGNPLYLKIATEEAKEWKSYTDIAKIKLSDDIGGIIRELFARLSLPSQHGEMVVSRALGYIVATRNGLSEDELLDVLGQDEEFYDYISRKFSYHEMAEARREGRRVPVAIWSRLYFDLAPYLTERLDNGAYLICFFHRHFSLIAKELYLSLSVKKLRHGGLANYFSRQSNFPEGNIAANNTPNFRKCFELPFQLRKAQRFAELEKLLTNLEFVEAKCLSGQTMDLLLDYEQLGLGSNRSGVPIVTPLRHKGVFGLDCVFCHKRFELPGSGKFSFLHIGSWFGKRKMSVVGELVICPYCQNQLKLNPFAIDAEWFVKSRERAECLLAESSEMASGSACDFSSVASEFADFVRAKAHLLSRYPASACQLAIDEPDSSALYQKAGKWLKKRSVLRWLNKPQEGSACIATLSGHVDWVMACAVSSDGRHIVSASEDKTLKLWDAASGHEIMTLFGHEAAVNALSFSGDGRFILSGARDCFLILWDAATGNELKRIKAHNGSIQCCAFSPDGQRFVSGAEDKTLKIRETDSAAELLQLSGHSRWIKACAFSPCGRYVLFGSSDKTLRLWDSKTGRELRIFAGHGADVNACAFSPCGLYVLSGSSDKTLRLWDLKSGKQLQIMSGHQDNINSCAFSPDGLRVVSASDDKTLKIWAVDKGEELLSLAGHSGMITSCVFSADGERLISGSRDNTLKIWTSRREQKNIISESHGSLVSSCDFSLDGSMLVSAGRDGNLRLWNTKNFKSIKGIFAHKGAVNRVLFLSDGLRLLSASEDRLLKLWNGDSAREVVTFSAHRDGVTCCALSSDNQKMVSGSRDQTLRLWDVASARELMTFSGHTNEINTVSFSCDDQQIISGSADKTMKIWDIKSGRELLSLTGHSAAVSCCAFLPDNQRIISASEDNTLKLWNKENGEELLTLFGHQSAIRNFVLFPDGQRLVSCAWKNLKIWDLTTGELLLDFHSTKDLMCIAITADGKQLAAGDINGQLLFFSPELSKK